MKEFKYDVVELIKGVRDRPCLWDKTIENYKDRVERRTAWEAIFNILDENYEVMTPDDKRITGELIINKWTNIRDTFVKTLKTKSGRPKKRYILYNHLKFLTKIKPEEECNIDYNNKAPEDPEPFMKDETEPDTSYGSRKRSKRKDFDDLKSNDDDVGYNPKKKSKRHDFSDEVNNSKSHRKRRMPRIIFENDSVEDSDDIVQIDETDDPRVMNEDEAFFASLLPSVVKYSEDERLEFRIEVLEVMKKIKDRRKWPGADLSECRT